LTIDLQAANIVKAFQFFWEWIFEEYGICSKLDRLQGHPAECFGKSVHALGPFDHVPQIRRQHLVVHTLGTLELLPWGHLRARSHFMRKRYRELTLIGGLFVVLATRKFMAMSSQFMCSSTQSLTFAGIAVVYRKLQYLCKNAAPVNTIDISLVHSDSYFQLVVTLSHLWVLEGNPANLLL
jgi:hypothetical protein